MSERMEYEEFKKAVIDGITAQVGEDVQVMTSVITKNNSVHLDGLSIREKGSKLAPTLYLNDLYSLMTDGMELEEIIRRAVVTYSDNRGVVPQGWSLEYTFEGMKDSIIYRLISYDLNEEQLMDMPYLKYKDLAVTFACKVGFEDGSIGTIRITNDHIKLWGVNVGDLYEAARRNTERLLPHTFQNMRSVMSRIIGERLCSSELGSEERNELIKMLESMCDEGKNSIDEHMFVLSNIHGFNGAAVILYEGLLERIAGMVGGGYYILPSSVHEIIIVPDAGGVEATYLRDLVKNVNEMNVPLQEILSDNVYHYPEDDFVLLPQQ